MKSAEAPPRTFFKIPLAMLETGSPLPCDIWLRHGEADPVLYRAGRLPFTNEHRERLAASRVECVWVAFDDAPDWARYVETKLRDRVRDDSVPVNERARLLVDTSRSIMKDVFEDPRAPETRGRVESLADAISDISGEPEAFAATIRVLEHDYYTYSHCVHVSLYAAALARAAGIDDEAVVTSISRGGLMHDCGKCALPTSIINKPGKLDESEWALMRTHPEEGVRVLSESGWKDDIARSVTHAHHERCDGSGYPRGILHKTIPEAARIVAICDAFDAMTTDRAYHRAMSGAEALRVIRVRGRDQYDQELVERFILTMLDPERAKLGRRSRGG